MNRSDGLQSFLLTDGRVAKKRGNDGEPAMTIATACLPTNASLCLMRGTTRSSCRQGGVQQLRAGRMAAASLSLAC